MKGLDGFGCVFPVIVPGTPVIKVVLGFVAGFTGWHCGTRQHESLGSVTIVQPGCIAGYVGHLEKVKTD